MGVALATHGAADAFAEVELRDDDLADICEYIYQRSGIRIDASKRELVRSRLGGRIRKLGPTRAQIARRHDHFALCGTAGSRQGEQQLGCRISHRQAANRIGSTVDHDVTAKRYP